MTKKIQIIGSGCPKCRQLAAHAEQAAGELGVDYEIEKVEKMQEIMAFGVMMTPALAVDGELKSAGKVLDAEAIKSLLR